MTINKDQAFKFIYRTFYGAIIVLVAFLLIALLPIEGNYQIKIVKSGSMEPAIRTGSIVVVKPSADYTVGDVIIFGKDTKTDIPITHRIVSSRMEGGATLFTTKGDANEDPDPNEVKQREVNGKVLFTVPFLGYIIDLARQPLGFTILIVLPALIVIYDEGAKILREIKKMRKPTLHS